MSITDLQTDRATARGPSGPKNVWTDGHCTGPVSLCHPGLVTGE